MSAAALASRSSQPPGCARSRSRSTTRGGQTHTVTLRNRATAPATLTLSRPRLKGSRVTTRVHIARLHAPAVMGVVLRVVQRGRVTARRVASVKHVHNGLDKLTFHLPRGLHGRAHLLTNANLITAPTAPTDHSRSRHGGKPRCGHRAVAEADGDTLPDISRRRGSGSSASGWTTPQTEAGANSGARRARFPGNGRRRRWHLPGPDSQPAGPELVEQILNLLRD